MDCPLRWEGLPSVPVSSGAGAYGGSGVRNGASLGPVWRPSQPPARLRSGETRCDAVVAMAMTTTSLGKLVVTCFPLVIELSHLLSRFVPVPHGTHPCRASVSRCPEPIWHGPKGGGSNDSLESSILRCWASWACVPNLAMGG
jgi:hypothetical protein